MMNARDKKWPARDSRGFSLLELVIVIAFIGILTSIAIPNYLNFQKRAREAEVRANLGAIRSTFIAYYVETDSYDVGDVGTLTYDATDNDGSPFGISTSAKGQKQRWDLNTAFSVVGFNAEGAVYFNYSLDTNSSQGEDASFTAMASADLDRNFFVSHFYISESSPAVAHEGDRY